MHVRMMLECLSPRVQHAQESEFPRPAFGICRDFEQRLCAGAEQQIIEQLFVVIHRGTSKCGNVNTTCTYATGNRSALRRASHFSRALVWHLGQWRLRHELNEYEVV